jgi:hypothetical protein
MKKPKLKYKVVKSIPETGYPTSAPSYHDAHMDANDAEKRVYGKKAFKKTLATDKKLLPHEQAATHTKSGRIKISNKIPKKERPEYALHEYVEYKRQCKTCKLSKNAGRHKK